MQLTQLPNNHTKEAKTRKKTTKHANSMQINETPATIFTRWRVPWYQDVFVFLEEKHICIVDEQKEKC